MSSILIVISITHSGLFLNNLYDTKLIVMRTIILTFAWLSLSVSALSQNLVAYYPFNGNANDESGNSINPTYTGAGVTLTTDRFDNANKAYHFDGAVNSYMRMPADMMPTTNRTISLWFNVPDVTNRPGLLGYGGNGSCGTTLLMGINLLGSGQFHVQGHCGNNAAGYTYLAAPVNNWYHWVLTINGSTQKIYVNGQLKSTDNTFSGSTAVSGKDFSLGVITSISGIAPFTDVNVGYLTGKLDDVRIYDAAMTDAQVLQLYNNETTGLVAYFPFNGNANDESGNANHGTVDGATLTTDRFNSTNKAYAFNGSSNYINVPDAAILRPQLEITLSAWVKRTRLGIDIITEKGGDWTSGTCNYGMGLHNINNNMFYFFFNGGWRGTDGLNDFNWHYYTVVAKNGDPNPVLYIDGVQRSVVYTSGAGTISMNNSPLDLHIGAQISGGHYGANIIDELKIYQRQLSAAEVQQNYNQSATGLVAYYPFNGNANDATGNNHNGTVSGATLTTDRFGNTNNAYSFNGSSNYIDINQASNLNLPEYTYTAWIYSTANPTGVSPQTAMTTILDIGDATADQYMIIFNHLGNSGIAGCGYYTGGGTYNLYSGTLPNLNQWYHVAITRSTTTFKLFINGQLSQTMPLSTAGPSYGISPAGLIGKRFGNQYYFSGKIDEVRIYDNPLPDAQVLQLYNNESAGLVAYYPFNGNANDATGNNHNGTVSGATLTTDRTGNASSAYVFNGSSDFIQINEASSLTLPQYTYSAWVNLNAYPPGYNVQTGAGTILDIGNISVDQYMYIVNYNPYYGFSGSGYYVGGGAYDTRTGVLPNLSQWYHVAVTRSTTEAKLFVNGILIQTLPLPAAGPDYGISPLAVIGKRIGDLQYFSGKIDEVRIYNRPLSPNEIAQLADVPVMPDLIAYLPMNGDANDKSGNNRNGSPYGGAALTTDKYDNANSAYYFTNPECGISLANSNALDFTGQPFAISAWVKYTNIPPADFCVVAKHNCGTPNGYLLAINNNSPRFYLCTGGSWSIISTTETYNDNKWHHLVATYDGTGSQQLYVDGELKASVSSVVFNTPGSGSPIIIGDANNNCGGATFSASIDEVKIYGTALDAAQVSALYKQSRGSGNAIRMQADGYIDIGYLGTSPLTTVEAWIKRSNTIGQYILSCDNALGWYFGVTDNRLFLSIIGGQADSDEVPEINDGKWHHVAVIFGSGFNTTFYVDGFNKGMPASTPWPANSNYSIGRNSGYSFNGEIDEVRIWNNRLDEQNPDIIRSWMNRKITPEHPFYSNLVRYYTFNEFNINKVYDAAGAKTGLMVNNIGTVLSGAPIGDASANDFAGSPKSATITVPTGESFNAREEMASSIPGISVYLVKDPPENQIGILGLGSNDHYFGVHKSGGGNWSYTTTYNYTGNTLVAPVTEPTLQLFKRDNSSVTTWANSGAVLNTTVNTLTVTGQNTEYILGSSGFGLPVTMLSFEARKINTTTVQLNWKTATEINNKGFEVQRSFDGTYFTAVSFVNGAGNSDVLKEYIITDVPGRTGRVYYRLRQVDVDGNSKLSPIASVVFDQQSMVKLYPNPAQHHVTIEGVDSYQRMQLLDVSGKMVKEQVLNGQTTIVFSLVGISNGLYLLRLMKDKEDTTIKLMIDK